MEKLFYSAKDVAEITGYSKNKSYDIIRKLNTELKEKFSNKENKPLIFEGRINKEYFDKRIKGEEIWEIKKVCKK